MGICLQPFLPEYDCFPSPKHWETISEKTFRATSERPLTLPYWLFPKEWLMPWLLEFP